MLQRIVGAVLFAFTLLIVISFGVIEFCWGNDAYMRHEFVRCDSPFFTGISADELLEVNEKVKDYIHGKTQDLYVTANIKGQEKSVFEKNELSHLAQVREVYAVFRVFAAISAVFILTYGAVIMAKKSLNLIKAAKYAAVLTAVLPFCTAFTFDDAFVLLHKAFFPKGNWMFDIEKSLMVNIYTEIFFEKLGYIIAICALLAGSAIFAAALAACGKSKQLNGGERK